MRTRLLGPLACIVSLLIPMIASGQDYIAYTGTYTQGGKSKGIYGFRFNTASGKLTPIGLMGERGRQNPGRWSVDGRCARCDERAILG